MHNPLRSERDVFRAVVVIGVGAGFVIALTLLTRPAFGAVLLAAEVGLGIWVLWRRARGTGPPTSTPRSPKPGSSSTTR